MPASAVPPSPLAGPLVLIVRDGWGRNPHPEHDHFNAIRRAETPVADQLLVDYPWTLIHTSGEEVGLPDGTMGNSEVGHQNLGAGRIVDQESVRITRAIRNGSFFDNEVLVGAVESARQRGGALHLLGLCSDAGVHALLTHLYGCLELCRRRDFQRVYLHLFTDGRDTGPFSGLDYLVQVGEHCRELGVGSIATLCGRYYAMDRDNRWERVERAYEALTGRGEPVPHFAEAEAAVRDYYERPSSDHLRGDEFVTPRTVGSAPQDSRVRSGDSIVFYNYRGDRPRELTKAFVLPDFDGHMPASPDGGRCGFDRGPRLDLYYATMTAYQESLNASVEVVFPKPPKMEQTAGAYFAELGLTQFRCAETEKFPHVTFFFNDYREPPFEGERRAMAQSPRVETYDQKPEMSAWEVRDLVLERLSADDCEDFLLVNFANSDMVGHTGNLEAAIRAAEVVDSCVGSLVEAALVRGGRLIVTADHGNSEQMWDPETESPHTAHTTYDVECIVIDPERRDQASGSAAVPSAGLRSDGRLADVVPTLLALGGLAVPSAMTGTPLWQPPTGPDRGSGNA